MTDKKRTIKYLLMIPVFLVMALPIAGYLTAAVSRDFVLLFFLCYFAIHIIISFLAVLLNKEKWDIVVSVVTTLILMLVFRDRVLILNMLEALAVAAVLYLLRQKKISRVGWTVLAALEIALWLLMDYRDVPKIIAICLILLAIYALGCLLNREVKYYIAVLFLLGIGVAFIPVKEDPIQWTLVKKGIEAAAKLIDKAGDELEYLGMLITGDGTSYTGYSDSNAFGGHGVKHREREDLFIETSTRRGSLYLKGRSLLDMDEEGFGTEEERIEPFNQWFVEYINALYHAGVTRDEAICFSKIWRIDIEYRLLRTDDLIAPSTVLSVEERPGKGFEGRKGRHYRYELKYMALDYSNPYLIRVLESDKAPYEDYDIISEYVRTIYNIDLSKTMTEEEYNSIAATEQDFSAYMDTSMATDRIRDLTKEVTADCTTDYQKAKAIETYLRQYTYSTDVERIEGENYIDRFLFEDRKGYCTYYAASMVLMLRLSGIPAKYSMGYMHTYKSDYSSVMSTEAHAWCEAYIDGYGWVPFEPTTVKETAEDLGWGLKVSSGSGDGEIGEAPTPYIPAVPQGAIPTEGSGITAAEQREFDRAGLMKFLSYIAGMVGIAVILLLIIKLIGYIRYLRMTPERKLTENVRRIRRLVEDRAFKEHSVRTIYEYAEAVKDPEKREELKGLFDEYYKVRFRGDAAQDEVVDKSRKLASFLSSNRKLIGGI